MFVKKFICVIAIIFAWGCKPKLVPLPSDAVVLAFGDSITEGYGVQPGEGYPETLSRLLSRRVINAGVSGEVTASGLTRLPQLLDTHKPVLVIICHGGNDMLRKMDMKAMADNLRGMIHLAKGKGAQVVLIGVPKPVLLPSVPELYEELAKEFDILYDGETLNAILTDNALKSDHIHPNSRGYARLAEAIVQLLKKHGAI